MITIIYTINKYFKCLEINAQACPSTKILRDNILNTIQMLDLECIESCLKCKIIQQDWIYSLIF